MYQYSYDTPIGKLYIAEKNDTIIKVSFFPVINEEKETSLIKETYNELCEYFKGQRKTFNIPISLQGTEFQLKIWQELSKIPYGETRCYKDIACAVGNPKASRAVGMANNKNPIAIIIPCHRVIGSNGNLTGYAGGLGIKEKLLAIECST